ncbi:helix-turn-helix transcriptional regulator [Desulfobacterales bacterium HSG17]|nr:helix-turn-helix transcriptional regulator [Desulfobacterales bacterium HSG17]
MKAKSEQKQLRLMIENIVHGFINNIDSIIYISDMKSYKILFMNNCMKELFGKDLTGTICWQSIHDNQDGPCKFCTNDKLINTDGNPSPSYVWEFYNQKLKKWLELHDMAIPWVNSTYVRMEIALDISQRKYLEQKQINLNKTLEEKVKERTAELEDMNAALNVLLKQRDEDKLEIEARIFSNYNRVIQPFINKLKASLTQKNQQYLVNIIESELQNILSPFSKKLSDPLIKLTPTEMLIATLIKSGKSNREVAEILNSSIHTISRHRENIRKKLGLKNEKINLRRFLSTLS